MTGKPITTEVNPSVATRLRLQSVVTGVAIKRLVNDLLDRGLPSFDELSGLMRESEATA